MTIARKIGAGFALVAFATAISGAIIYWKAVEAEALVAKSVELRIPALVSLQGTAAQYESGLAAMRGYYVLGADPAANERLRRERQAAWKAIDENMTTLQELAPRFSLQETRDHLATLRTELTEYRQLQDTMEDEAHSDQASKREHAVVLLKDTAAAKAKAIRADVSSLVESNLRLYRDDVASITASNRATRIAVWISVVCAILFGIAVATVLGSSMSKLLAALAEKAHAIASGDLSTAELQISSHDEIGQLAGSVNEMQKRLAETLQSVGATAEHVASASEEISASATQTANGSETQKDQVHQVATAMQEMSATVHEVSENCNKAAESAHQTAKTAREGGLIVEDTLVHMRSIAGSVRETAQKVQELGSRSDQIGKIVGVIDDIADQTNLLALNAAIEAARAGEQGRGFAVVADEVRKLAERTTKATKEIAEMIQSVQTETRGAVEKMQSGTQQVEKGVEVTAKAGESLKQIIGQAEHVGEMVTHIATAANEQSSATEQVNNNMDQISKLVAESAEGSQQSAKACEQLSSLAFELQNLVSRFKLGQQAGTGYRSPRQAAADPGRVRTALALAPRPAVQRVFDHVGQDRNGE